MSAGRPLLELLAELLNLVRERHPIERETILMQTAEHLAKAVDKLLADNADQKTQIASLQSQLTAADAAAVTEADAEAMITKIEAVTGPITDDAPVA